MIRGPAQAAQLGLQRDLGHRGERLGHRAVLLRALGQLLKRAWSSPGTVASITSAMRSIFKPSPSLASRTVAVVSMVLTVMPAFSQETAKNIVKQAACAAPRISSGLVPLPSAKRLATP